jgi:glycosyltransferase involved in cell wall biosynthesis
MKVKYKIAFLMHGARNVGGGEYSIYYLIKNLRRDTFSPVVFYAFENEIIERLKDDGIPLVHVPLDKRIISVYRDAIRLTPSSLMNYARFLVRGILKTAELLQLHHVDLLHPHDNLSKIIGGFAALRAGVPVVCHCRDLLKGNIIEKMLIYHQLLFMDRIVAVSESNRALFRCFGKIPGKVVTIYNGIDLTKFTDSDGMTLKRDQFNIRADDFVIGIIGVFDRIKGHTYLFQALEMLVADGIKNIVCLVVGDGRWRARLSPTPERGRASSMRSGSPTSERPCACGIPRAASRWPGRSCGRTGARRRAATS